MLRRRDCHAALAMTNPDTPRHCATPCHCEQRAYCHCEERSDVAISLRLSTCRGTIIATATRLPRCARNDKPRHPPSLRYPLSLRAASLLSLRGAQRRGNLVEVEHVPGNHHCYGDEIATPVSSAVAMTNPDTPRHCATPCHCEQRAYCHCEERSDVAISLRLSTCRGTIIATATRLPRCARNDRGALRSSQ